MMTIMQYLDEGTITSPEGFQSGAVAAGIKKAGANIKKPLDLALIYSDRPCTAAGLFTTNQVVAAPVLLSRQTLAANDGAVQAVVANAGNANACTGVPGYRAAEGMQQSAAFALGLPPEAVLVLSTGVIGVQMPMPRINAGIDGAARRLSPDRGDAVARAIMTTDTIPKQAAVRVPLSSGQVTIGGVAKGAGMIHPNMATMLGIITTDVAAPTATLQRLLRQAADASFNRISVDGDTSTNDTVLLLANGVSSVALTGAEDEERFAGALTDLCTVLAKLIVRDGEGATRFAEIRVAGAPDDGAARAVANAIATSPLVKTALAGGDANWGRILAAAGRAGVRFDQQRIALWIGPAADIRLQLVAGGTPTAYDEEEATAIFAGDEIHIFLDLGAGQGTAVMWTCDLTHDYVTINAHYRT